MSDPTTMNHPDVWLDAMVWPRQDSHKYDRGHSLILGADHYTGATRLAAEACSRIGSGLVTVHSDTRADLYRHTLPPDIMIRSGAPDAVHRPTAILAGPGGCGPSQRAVLRALPADLPRILDAEAIVPATRNAASEGATIVTPHEGEFKRAFPELTGDRMGRAVAAAGQTGWITVLKGAETCIAAPDGRCVLNHHATPWLAKAGTGDVLAGLVTGLVAQGMAPFDAACAAVWIHGEAGRRVGPGLVPQDLFDQFGAILTELEARALGRPQAQI